MQYTEGCLTSSWAHRISTRSKCWVEYWCTGDHTSIRDPKLALDFELALDLDKWIPSWNIFHFCSIFLDRPLKIYQYKSVGIWFSDVCSLKLVFRVLFTVFSILIYLVLREKLCLFAQRYQDTNSYLDNISSKIRKDIIILTTPSIWNESWLSLGWQFYRQVKRLDYLQPR